MENFVYSKVGGQQIVSRVDSHIEFTEGDQFDVFMNLKKMHIFDGETKKVVV